MGTLKKCLSAELSDLPNVDKDDIRAGSKEYQSTEGYTPAEAHLEAVKDKLSEYTKELTDIHSQITKAGGIVPESWRIPVVEVVEAVKEAKPSGEKIEDVGEKIGGARKDTWAGFRDKVSNDLSESDILALPLSKSFPEPNYKTLAEQGANAQSLALIKVMREEIPAKPRGRSNFQKERYVEGVTVLRKAAKDILDNPAYAGNFLDKMRNSGMINTLADRVDLMLELGFPGSAADLKGITLEKRHYASYGDERNVNKWIVDVPAKSRKSFGGMGGEIAASDTRETAVEALKHYLETEQAKPKTGKQTSFDVYQYRAEPGRGWIVGKKVGGNHLDLAEGFKTAKEARSHIDENQNTLEQTLKHRKEIPAHRRATNEVRIGKNYREDKDVSADDFRETFGFRGVEFGNWVEQAKRQESLNDAYDGLMDLANLLDIPSKAISLDGELGMAFGARGKGKIAGGITPAAHYEPSRVVINLTKKKGAGSLAHEWFHALDNYFSRMRGDNIQYVSDRPYELMDKSVRKEVLAKFKGVMTAIKASGLPQRALKLDGRKTKNYWSTSVEMSARSFESYVIERLKTNGFESDYLANIVSKEYWDAAEALGLETDSSYPYPIEAEQESIHKSFDDLFSTIQTKETDNGVAIYETGAEYVAQLEAKYEPNKANEKPFKEAAQAVERVRRIEGSILANSMPKDFQEEGKTYLIGQTINNHKDLAALAQIYRNPSFETFRIFFMKGARVVGQTGITSRLPGASAVFVGQGRRGFSRDAAIEDLNAKMKASGADSYYLLHNHPSGNPTPSGSDLAFTGRLSLKLPGLKSHIVINHEKYVSIATNEQGAANYSEHALDTSKTPDRYKYNLASPKIPHKILGERIMQPKDAAHIGAALAGSEGTFQLVGRKAGLGGIAGVMDVPLDVINEGRPLRLAAEIRKFARATGAKDMFAVNIPDGRYKSLTMRAIEKGLLTDVIYRNGDSLRILKGITPDPGMEYGRPLVGLAVEEKKAGYSKRGLSGKKPELNEFQKENQRLREEDTPLWEKADKTLKRYFSPGGLLPKEVFDEKIIRDSEFEVVEFDVRHLVGRLEIAVKKEYGKRFEALDKPLLEKLGKALTGDVDPSIPESVRSEIYAMRGYIDGLSAQYVEIINNEVDTLTQEGSAAAQAKAGLLETIVSNIGTYVNRSYRAFDDKTWFKKIPDNVLNAARDYIRDRHISNGEDAAEAGRLAEVALHEIVKTGTAYDSMESFIKESKLGAKDLSVLKHRKQIAPEIRALLGEYVDPRLSFAKSASKMGRLIWNQKFLDRVLVHGMDNFLFEGTDRPPEATKQFAADGSESYAPLNGLWTYPEIEEAFRDALGKEQMENWYRTIVQMNGMVKFGKTILSPTTAMRNWQSAMFFTLANGHFDISHASKSLAGLREYFTQQGEGSKLAYLREMKELGVVYDTPYAGEMMRLLDDSRMEDMLKGKRGKAVSIAEFLLQNAQKFYQYGDDFWKIIGFENEKNLLMKHAGLSEQAAKKKAAERIRNTYPTYSMVGKAMQSLRRFPLAGTFVSFPSEIIRTSIHIVKYMAEDMKTPGMRPIAMRRAAGLAIVSSFAYALQEIMKTALGVDDDEEEAVRLLAAPWQRNSNLIFTGRGENGELQYFDISFLDPYNYWKRPITAVIRDQDWKESAKDVLKETLSPFLGTDIAAGAVFEILANKKESGAPVYSEHDQPWEATKDIANHLRKNLQPGVMANVERTMKAINGERSPSGRKYNIADEAMAWGGWRVSTLDPKVALYYRSYDFKDIKRDATRKINKVIRNPNKITKDELKAAWELSAELRQKAYGNMFKIIHAASKSGLSVSQIRRILLKSGISKIDVAALMRDTVPTWKPSAASLRNALKKADMLFDKEAGARFRERHRELQQLSRE